MSYMVQKAGDPFYYSSSWRRLRQMALARDNYLCVRCLAKKRIVAAEMVHHVKPRDQYPELELDVGNLASLCNRCHEHEHNRRAVLAEPPPKGVRVIRV